MMCPKHLARACQRRVAGSDISWLRLHLHEPPSLAGTKSQPISAASSLPALQRNGSDVPSVSHLFEAPLLFLVPVTAFTPRDRCLRAKDFYHLTQDRSKAHLGLLAPTAQEPGGIPGSLRLSVALG